MTFSSSSFTVQRFTKLLETHPLILDVIFADGPLAAVWATRIRPRPGSLARSLDPTSGRSLGDKDPSALAGGYLQALSVAGSPRTGRGRSAARPSTAAVRLRHPAG